MLSIDTEVEVVCKKKDKVVKNVMTLSKWKKLKTKPGWNCRAYQIGFSQFKTKL